jgi:hypothetical protein
MKIKLPNGSLESTELPTLGDADPRTYLHGQLLCLGCLTAYSARVIVSNRLPSYPPDGKDVNTLGEAPFVECPVCDAKILKLGAYFGSVTLRFANDAAWTVLFDDLNPKKKRKLKKPNGQ